MSSLCSELTELLQQFSDLQSAIVTELKDFGSDDYQQQYHQDLSPVGWHVGHCVYTENYWIREQWLNTEHCEENLKQLYVPELSRKQSRGNQLPEYTPLLKWAQQQQIQNIQLLKENIEIEHHYTDNYFLLRFLIQHYCQHLETIAMIRQCKLLAEYEIASVDTHHTASVTDTHRQHVLLDDGEYHIGSTEAELFSYDNEQAAHPRIIQGGKFSTHPVSNHQYLEFIHAGGYEQQEYWTEAGWQWRQTQAMPMPFHWVQHDKHYYEVTDQTVTPLRADHPVYGINHHEAQAYANFAGGYLPSEFQWEAAARNKLLQQSGVVWEWCVNHFAPYPEFKAYPYAGYSVPYFDNKHFVLKGGSQHSHHIIKRPGFRNYYQADKRHIFAGVRLLFD